MLLLKKPLSCGGSKLKWELQRFGEELAFLLAVQNRGCAAFPFCYGGQKL